MTTTASSSRFSLAEIARGRLLGELLRGGCGDDVEKGKISSPPKVLVVDGHTLKIISSVCRRFELSDKGAIFIEQIEKQRQPFPDLEVVYFVTPSAESVQALLKDHASGMYGNSCNYFSSGLSESLFGTLTSNKEFVSRCQDLVELNLDFVPFESRVFHCDRPFSLCHLTVGSEGSLNNQVENLIQSHVSCLASVFASVGEVPVVRFMRDASGVANSAQTAQNSAKTAEKIAFSLKKELDNLTKSVSALKHSSQHAPSCLLLVVDRSIETAPMFIHDFHYQALALDILDGIDPNGAGVQWALDTSSKKDDGTTEQAISVIPSFDYKTTTGKGIEERRKVLLGEWDPLWVKFKHQHFQVVAETVRSELSKLGVKSSIGETAGDPLEILRKIPEFQDQLSKLSVHLELCRRLMDVFKKLNLMEVSSIEQQLATGVDADGKEVSCQKLYQTMASLLGKPNDFIGSEERLRLAALYLSQVNDISESTAQDLVKNVCRLDSQFEHAVSKFLALGIHGTRVACSMAGVASVPDGVVTTATDHKRGSLAPGIQTSRHSVKLDKSQIKRNKQIAKNAKFVNCQFQSSLAATVEQCLTNQLDLVAYPLAGPAGTNFAFSTNNSSSDVSKASQWGQFVGSSSRQKMFVFVVGGITLIETRELEALGEEFNVDIVAGGSAILTPKRVVEILIHGPTGAEK